VSKILTNRLNYYLSFLYLEDAKVTITQKDLDENGIDDIILELKGVKLDTISSGEFNRLRLALLSCKTEFEQIDGGVLFLDEIDANLSGKESASIAKLLQILSNSYQIFAISHQPQLTASANQHIYIEKIDGISKVKILNEDEKIKEIARMISDEHITPEALNFARKMEDDK
jgi:DNA repair protein RecN (Recombination protein N)